MVSIALVRVTFLDVGNSMTIFQNVRFPIRLSNISDHVLKQLYDNYLESMESVVHSWG